ncbi:RNA-binding domain-containing protein [Backusella circina FSU 941]|nr:RNA-binding domain-containing protein [Backusella circina FSU 941]
MADALSPSSGTGVEDYPPPPPPPPSNSQPGSRRGDRSPSGRDRSHSPSSRRSPSNGRYYDERRSYRDDDRLRYDSYPRRNEYYSSNDRYARYDSHHSSSSSRYDHRDRYDRYDRYDHRDRYDRYDDRRGGGGRYPPRARQRRPVDRGTEQERKSTSTIYVGNLPYDFIERDVADMFERYGPVKSITVPMDVVTNKNKGFAFVEFEERQDAEEAYSKFDGFSVEGRRLRLDWDIGLSKKDENRPPTRRGPSSGPPLDDPRERSLNDPYSAPPPPLPPMDSRGYRRDSPEPYRR